MITMKQARRDAPARATERKIRKGEHKVRIIAGKVQFADDMAFLPIKDPVYDMLAPRWLTEPFRKWARIEFANRKDLSPKLKRVVVGVS